MRLEKRIKGLKKNKITNEMKKNRCLTFVILAILIIYAASCQESSNEIISYQIASPFQSDYTTLRVLTPDNMDLSKKYNVLYVLPVIENDNRRFGDGLLEMQKYNYHNKYQLICVAPEFTSMPWYADHSTDRGKQDESHMLETIIPFIDENYPTLDSNEGRLLVGFSKSGWGALTLLLRNPEIFWKAVGWDIGIRIDTEDLEVEKLKEKYKRDFGSKDNFEEYRISTLLKERKDQLGTVERIFYYNTEGKRGPGGMKIHQLMVELGMPHRYLYEPKRKHRWDTGWIPEAVKFLVE
ncbi:MAG: hypothetical protein ACI9FN_001151 [Saprospiraceae bacterium]|jgi:hypothetical protein